MKHLIIIFTLLAGSAQAQTFGAHPISPGPYCVGDILFVSVTPGEIQFGPGNVFYVELSDPYGTFTTYSSYSDTNINMPVQIPLNAPGGIFRVRARAIDPDTISGDNGADIQVFADPVPHASMVIGTNRLAANATDSTSGPAVMVGQPAQFAAAIDPSDAYNWILDEDASIHSALGPNATVSYQSLGLKTGTLTAVSKSGCSASAHFAIRVLDCRPTIPKSAHVVTGFERVMDTFVWVKSGGVDTVDNTIPYPQTIYVEPGGRAFGTADVAWNTFYIKSGATINHLPERGTVVNSLGIRDTFEGQVPADTLSCDNLDFDYSQVQSSVSEAPTPVLSLHQSGDHLFANTEETPAEIRIMSILGAEVLSQRVVGELDVDLSPLPAGVYFAVVQSGDAREVRKIAVVH